MLLGEFMLLSLETGSLPRLKIGSGPQKEYCVHYQRGPGRPTEIFHTPEKAMSFGV